MLDVQNLRIHFRTAPDGHDAVRGVSFTVKDGEIMGLVGESGSGKTATAMALCGLLPRHRAECSGKVLLDGADLLSLPREELRRLQGGALSVVFQEPMTSFDPCMRIGPQVEEALLLHTDLSPEKRREAALAAMEGAELPDPAGVYRKYPHELSGGMLQRAMIAAAVISGPSLLVCDEPTTALDVTTQAQILALLRKINREKGTSILFISHNLNVVRRLCSSLLVMHDGQIVERGDPEAVFRAPKEAYTRRLIDSIPTREHRIYRERGPQP